jgi:hypothetical protein
VDSALQSQYAAATLASTILYLKELFSKMQPTSKKLGRIYTTLSLAVLPVALVMMFVFLYSLKEHGPQSQGLPALVMIYAVILGVLGINTLAATLLSVLVAEVRPATKQYFLTLLALSVLAGLSYLVIFLSSGSAGA